MNLIIGKSIDEEVGEAIMNNVSMKDRQRIAVKNGRTYPSIHLILEGLRPVTVRSKIIIEQMIPVAYKASLENIKRKEKESKILEPVVKLLNNAS